MRKAELFEQLPDHRVKCTACKHYCEIADSASGICGVRKNIGGELFLLVYGQAAAAHVDPIEKKPLYHFLPGQPVFTVGTIGCNFGCDFCQNWDISQASKTATSQSLLGQGISAYGHALSPEEIIAHCKEQGARIVAFSYNEPAVFLEYALDTMRLAKTAGVRTVFVSNGYESKESLSRLSGYLDAINIDLKSFDEGFYRKRCKAKLANVLQTIKDMHAAGIWIELTTLLIPGENDSDGELEQLVAFIASIDKDIPWHVSAFHPDYKMQSTPSTPHASLVRAYEIGKRQLHHVYVGNTDDAGRSATYCPSCKSVLVDRSRYAGNPIGITDAGTCEQCDTAVAGVWQ